ncbi:MAG: SGNH/GDSL hydrolase family protein [Bacteroidales bacterium]|nr:SGNH/GDSL hydrolase family protein [Bacteroidales bacterium]
MKKILLCLGMMLLFSISAFSQKQAKDWAQIGRYEKSNKELVQENGRTKNRVVFLGNSITDNWARMRPNFFSDNNFIGRGISGQTSYQFLIRFRPDVIDLQPKLVVINAGTNDVAENVCSYNEDVTFGNIVSMVELARVHKIKVILTTVLPAAGFGWRPEIKDAPDKIASLNARLAEYAKAEKIPFVDYYTALAAPDRSLKKEYSNDGVHPTDAGYEIMESIIKNAVRKIVK